MHGTDCRSRALFTEPCLIISAAHMDGDVLTADDLVFFASTSARARDVKPICNPFHSADDAKRCRVKYCSHQVHLLQSLCALRDWATVDYVHALLASCPVHTPGGLSGLDAIRNASEGVSPALFDRAISLWREMCDLDERAK